MINQTSSAGGRLWRYGPLLLWIVFISFASTAEFSAVNTSTFFRPLVLWLFPTLSEAKVAAIHFLLRKIGHFTEYAVLAFLARRAFITSSRAWLRQGWFQCGLLLVMTYALLDEFHQSFVPSRSASIYDSAIDIAGGFTVLLLFRVHERASRTREVKV
ncbi:MAG TPA: VanZ family protein [Pyrinomonadaceae bacterium]|nr:VanZ family protein [Pyrinomonadaceae bacterium]